MSGLSTDEVFDFVVVGSGGGSMCAALMMRSLGRSVVILEKCDLVGGTTARSGGVMWIPNNRFLAEDGIEDSVDKAMTYLEATSGQSVDAPGSTLERRRAYVTEAPKMIDFLASQQIKLRRVKYYPDYYDDRPGGLVPGRAVVAELFDASALGEWRQKLRPNFIQMAGALDELIWLPTFNRSWKGRYMLIKVLLRGLLAKLTGKHWVTAGAALQGRMLQSALKAGVDIRTNSAVKSFIVEDGAVKGVVTTKHGSAYPIGARLGVLVNAGGFAHNQQMRDRYMPGTSSKWTAASPGDTGEMILELIHIGAATAQMEEMVGNQSIIPPGCENKGDGIDIMKIGSSTDIAKPHAILVDQSGARYMNESGSYMEFCQNMLKRDRKVPAIPSWCIMDAQFMESYLFCGTIPGSRKPKSWSETGFLKSADTIEDLARACDIDPTTLRATIDRFNGSVRTGRDDQFHRGERAFDNWLGDPVHKPSQTLGTIEKPPFYAAPLVPGDVSTYGGVVTDSHARVLRADGSPISGLYATGTTTASVMGRYYPGPGSSVGPSFTWGYVAAKHAAGLSD
jgi:3-oxosteroid 1-dehydrogenase